MIISEGGSWGQTEFFLFPKSRIELYLEEKIKPSSLTDKSQYLVKVEMNNGG